MVCMTDHRAQSFRTVGASSKTSHYSSNMASSRSENRSRSRRPPVTPRNLNSQFDSVRLKTVLGSIARLAGDDRALGPLTEQAIEIADQLEQTPAAHEREAERSKSPTRGRRTPPRRATSESASSGHERRRPSNLDSRDLRHRLRSEIARDHGESQSRHRSYDSDLREEIEDRR